MHGDRYRIDREMLKNEWPMMGIDLACDDRVVQIKEPGSLTRSTYSDVGLKVDSSLIKQAQEWLKTSKAYKNNNKNKSSHMDSESSGKFYKVIKETPAWDAGAVLKFDGDDSYKAVNTLFNREHTPSTYFETKAVVENEKDYFERVYQAVDGKKTVYVSKAKAKELFTASTTVTA